MPQPRPHDLEVVIVGPDKQAQPGAEDCKDGVNSVSGGRNICESL